MGELRAQLRVATREQLIEMMRWFPDRKSCSEWGGPAFRFPFTQSSFLEDAHWPALPSYSLMSHEGDLLGFGQYYLRAGRCHLGRLAIAPAHRYRGLGKKLIAGLIEIGRADLGVEESSLFVLENNEAALRCYRKIGFRPVDYPGEMPALEGCMYMISRHSRK